jgi:hypothetical protein
MLGPVLAKAGIVSASHEIPDQVRDDSSGGLMQSFERGLMKLKFLHELVKFHELIELFLPL